MRILFILFAIFLFAGCDTSSGTTDPKPEDFNRDGEYKPVEDMSQREIREELEEIIADGLTD